MSHPSVFVLSQPTIIQLGKKKNLKEKKGYPYTHAKVELKEEVV